MYNNIILVHCLQKYFYISCMNKKIHCMNCLVAYQSTTTRTNKLTIASLCFASVDILFTILL